VWSASVVNLDCNHWTEKQKNGVRGKNKLWWQLGGVVKFVAMCVFNA
jgi:hypothetical protein